MVQSQPMQRVCKTLSRKYSSQKRTGGVAQGVGPEFKYQYHKKKKKITFGTKEKLVDGLSCTAGSDTTRPVGQSGNLQPRPSPSVGSPVPFESGPLSQSSSSPCQHPPLPAAESLLEDGKMNQDLYSLVAGTF
jgi:hypothetical protein